MLPATNIAKVHETDSSVMLTAQCSCTDSSHSQTLCLDFDDELYHVTLTIYSTIHTKYINKYSENWMDMLQNYWDNTKRKYSAIWDLLWTGQILAESEFLFDSEQQITDYVDALSHYANKLKQNNT